jgi:hypothetical protein
MNSGRKDDIEAEGGHIRPQPNLSWTDPGAIGVFLRLGSGSGGCHWDDGHEWILTCCLERWCVRGPTARATGEK